MGRGVLCRTTPTEDIWLDGFNVHQTHLHGGSLVESGFEPGAHRPSHQAEAVSQIQDDAFTYEWGDRHAVKQAIHMQSKLKFLEHEKETAFVSFKN
ncbi:hypothetical protein AVEN_221384-1 [Araneus ventricosus]|uniref:Uncharacterized protein n=1 Tax=Araneus ventricosus TaxID=182803 RepID=A0A4Y2RNG1_ARAVE|nr:hypothetical protein AVEN_203264-1 [Araneus ventricosus]GBN77362.1 hypothetical protein AVEN_221384-1 [Araneus ventricosus]